MLYRFAHSLMWITFKIFFRRIDVIGLDKLHHDQPALLIANHPASFLDAMVLAVFLKRSVYFYVRGDIFKHPVVYKIFTKLHMIPIFNQGDGLVNLSKNQHTFEGGRIILSAGNLLLVFPEGFSRFSKALAPFKKGAARVALQSAFEQPRSVHLYIQTVAINYSSHAMGANLLIRVGEQLDLSGYQQLYTEAPAKAINKLTVDMFDVFHQNVIHVKQEERTSAAEEVIRMFYHCNDFDAQKLFQQARDACTEISILDADGFEKYNALINEQKKQLHMHGLTDQTLAGISQGKWLIWRLVFMSPLFFMGLLIWGLPGKISQWIADTYVTREDFYTSVHSGVLGVLGLLWWLMLLGISSVVGGIPLILMIFISPIFAYVAVRWKEEMEQFRACLRMKNTEQVVVDRLRDNRKKILVIDL